MNLDLHFVIQHSLFVILQFYKLLRLRPTIKSLTGQPTTPDFGLTLYRVLCTV